MRRLGVHPKKLHRSAVVGGAVQNRLGKVADRRAVGVAILSLKVRADTLMPFVEKQFIVVGVGGGVERGTSGALRETCNAYSGI